MKKVKNVILWIIGIFFILTCCAYINEIPAPSILMLIAGIILLPPITENIQNKIEDEEKIKRYKLIRNIMVIVFSVVFASNVPMQNINVSSNANESNESNITNTINKKDIDKSVTSAVTEKNGTYTGERIDGKKEGTGKFEWANGAIYEGEFANDEINGQGKLTTPKQGTYEGTFANGKRSGQGTYTFSNGDIYQGNWADDKMSGKGTYTFSNGDTYVGEFSNNKFNGQGTYTKGNNKYTGTWSDNEYKK